MTQDDSKKVEQLKEAINQRLSNFGFQLIDTTQDNRQTRAIISGEIYHACRQLANNHLLALNNEIDLPDSDDDEAWMDWYCRTIDYWLYSIAEAVINVGLQTALREALEVKEEEIENQGCFWELDNPFE